MPHPRHIYVHVPFCARKCSYCDFSIAVRSTVPVGEYVGSIRRELEIRYPARSAGERWDVSTLYLGGGTPSRLGAEGLVRLLDVLRDRITLEPEAEITLEANPDDVSLSAALAWRRAGINRLSIGAQSFDDAALRWMHRTHDATAIHTAVEAIRLAGFTDFSLDLIFALPTAVERDWKRDLAIALSLAPTHISLYGLTIEPMTPLGRWRSRGEITEAPEERYEVEYLHAHEALALAGFDHYEVSNFGLPANHARHNSAYWTGSDYAGLGPAAHGLSGTTRRWNVSAYAEWVRQINDQKDPIAGSELLDVGSRAAEEVYLGLRTARGLVIQDADVSRIQPWLEAGWGTVDSRNRLVLNERGWLRLDALAADLTHFRSR